jgi:hypothetical protein
VLPLTDLITIAAPSGGLGVTIGEAEITAPDSARATVSKYMTVGPRQPDGSLMFVVDAGKSIPARK